MDERGKSDNPVVPAKPPNKAGRPVAEVVEGRGLAEGNTDSSTRPGRSAGPGVSSGLDRVREVARRDKEARFTALLHHVDLGRLWAAYVAINPKAAPGVDRVTWEAYGQDLRANLEDLLRRVHSGAYRASPSRRVYIPKPDGRQRPVGRKNSDSRRDQGLRTIRRCSSYSGWSSACLPACSSSQALTRRPRTWRSWSCSSSSGCCAARPDVQVHPSRPGPAGGGKPPTSSAAVDVVVPGHAADAPALASRAGATQVDLPQHAQARPATARPRGGHAGAAHGEGEPALGLRQDLRGASQARHPGQRHHDQVAAATRRAGPGTAARRADLDAVPQSPGRGDRGLRLLHSGDDLAQDAVRLVFHPAQHQAGYGRR